MSNFAPAEHVFETADAAMEHVADTVGAKHEKAEAKADKGTVQRTNSGAVSGRKE